MNRGEGFEGSIFLTVPVFYLVLFCPSRYIVGLPEYCGIESTYSSDCITPKAPDLRALNGLCFKAVARWGGVALFVKAIHLHGH